MCNSSTCPNNETGIGADFLCDCEPENQIADNISEENKRIARTTWRDPLPSELNLPEFEVVWNCIKNWDIGLPFDITKSGAQLYSGATGNHVVAILDALRNIGVIKQLEQPEST